nr:hypothetical protein GCM10025699_33570 [Microbacterium flavescens]
MQEFFLAPIGAETFSESLRWGTEVYHVLKGELKAAGFATGLGDEGGFAPDLPSNREGLDFLVKAIEKAGFTPGSDIALGLDVAATEFFNDGVYRLDNKDWSAPSSPSTTSASSTTTRSSRSRTRSPRTTGTTGRPSPTRSALARSWWATTCSSPTRRAWPTASSAAWPTRSW